MEKKGTLRNVWIFFALAYMIAWGAWLFRPEESGTIPTPIEFVTKFAPTIAGLVMAFAAGGWATVKGLLNQQIQWRVSWRWFAVALLIPLAIAGLALAGQATLGEVELQTDKTVVEIVGIFLSALLIKFFLGGGLGEEIGWRGFALPRLTAHYGTIRATLLIGVVWAFWHLPAHLDSDSPIVGIIFQLLFTIPYAFILTWVYERTNASLLIPSLLHAAGNAFLGTALEEVFPVLDDEALWLLLAVLMLNIWGFFAYWKLRR